MTNTAPDDSVDPTADQQAHRPDELEDWLSDLRVNLGEDPPGWLTPEDDAAEAPPEPASAEPVSAEPAPAEPASAPPDEDLTGEPPGPAVGRHRAAE